MQTKSITTTIITNSNAPIMMTIVFEVIRLIVVAAVHGATTGGQSEPIEDASTSRSNCKSNNSTTQLQQLNAQIIAGIKCASMN